MLLYQFRKPSTHTRPVYAQSSSRELFKV